MTSPIAICCLVASALLATNSLAQQPMSSDEFKALITGKDANVALKNARGTTFAVSVR